MLKFASFFVGFVFAALAALPALAQPANNNFGNSWQLTGVYVTTNGNSTSATRQTGEPYITGNTRIGGRSVWFNWTAPASGQVTIDTLGSSFNTLLGVYTGTSVSALTLVVDNDDISGTVNQSRVTFWANQGTKYQIDVDGRGSRTGATSGPYVLTLQMLPSISLTSPLNGSYFAVNGDIPLAVSASSPVNKIAKVDYYQSGVLFATATEAPYDAIFLGASYGTNLFTAVMTDSAGLSTTSAVVRVTVIDPGIVITSPRTGASFLNTNTITITGVAVDPTGVANTEFFVDGVKIGESATSPYSAKWTNVSSGLHFLTAQMTTPKGVTYLADPVSIAVAKILAPSNSVWKYLDDGSNQGTNWIAPSFDDSAWASGPAELGYGDGDEATVVNGGPTNSHFITTYFRRAFQVNQASCYTNVLLSVRRDDGAVVYLNGVEAARFNMPAGPVNYSTLAYDAADDGYTIYTSNISPALLLEGINVFAVEIHQYVATSSDISFDLQMLGIPNAPENIPPVVRLTSPAPNSKFVSPTDIVLAAEASDADDTVSKLEFFADGASLGVVTSAPYSLTWANAPAGLHTLTVVATDDRGASTYSAPVALRVFASYDQWSAYNAHVPGPNTHANVTLWNVFGNNSGSLTNLATGQPLPVTLAITQTGAQAEPGAGTPLLDTPAYTLFGGIIDFAGSPAVGPIASGESIALGKNASVLHTFTGLDPQKRYSFRGTAIRGDTTFTDRWSVFELLNATSFASAHSAGVLAGEKSGVAPAQAAMNTGDNSAGEVIGWDNIVPNPDGTFAVSSMQYFGAAPGNEVPGPNGYALTAIRLDEFAPIPVVALTQPAKGLFIAGLKGPTNVTFAASATAFDSVTNVLFLVNGEVVGNSSSTPYGMIWTNTVFGDMWVSAVACAANGALATSAPVAITIVSPPINVDAPLVIGSIPAADASLTSLSNVHVTFSERVVGVVASDLIINDTPATQVTGGGSNYTFTFPQPPFGLVLIHWSPNHHITDIGWPTALAFHETSPGAVWSYTLLDKVVPVIVAKNPSANAIVSNLTQVSVTFSKAVTGVDASDFLVAGVPALGVSGAGSNYTFSIMQPKVASVFVSWVSGHGIRDTAVPPNNFNSTAADATWRYTLDLRSYMIQTNSSWLFLKGTADASAPIDAWRQLSFDDSSWSNAPSPFFYGDTGYTNNLYGGTSLSDMRGAYSSIYLRKTFFLPNAASVTNLYLRVQSDAAFIAWINGVEVARYNMLPGDMPFNTNAIAPVQRVNNAAMLTSFILADPRNYLAIGTNIITVQAFSDNAANTANFGFNAQMYTFMTDTELVAPRVFNKSPLAGSVFALTNITVVFTEPVSGVKASDLLVNGAPAMDLVTNNNYTYTFSFLQPDFGPVAITWATNQAITDLDITPKAFLANDSSALWHYSLLNAGAPYILSESPLANLTLYSLNQITVTFSEPVTGVDASDLLVNGIPATNVIGANDIYTFQFTQPPYGNVLITWAADHGIQDLATPATAFDATWTAHSWVYALVDKTPPAIATQNPLAGSYIEDLQQITFTFTEPVTGVDANDLLINGAPALSMTGGDMTYTFTFPQVNASVIHVTWAADHGIQDSAVPPNLFDPSAPGCSWFYDTLDDVAPTAKSISPSPRLTVRSLMQITVLFDEPVTGLDASALLINDVPAQRMTGSGAGPYIFTFAPVADGLAQVKWNPASNIQDLASPSNVFAKTGWYYIVNSRLLTETAVQHVIQISLDGAGAFYLQTYMSNAPARFANFARLQREGASTMNARCDYDNSVTLPNHADIFTGLTMLQAAGSTNTSYHGITFDGDTGQTLHNSGNLNMAYKMSVFDVVHDSGLSTAFLYSKKSLDIFARSWDAAHGQANENGSAKIDNAFSSAGSASYGSTTSVVDQVFNRVSTNTLWNYTFLHFNDGDSSGHASTWGSAAYSNALAAVDGQIGRILSLIDSSPDLFKQTVLMVTADHGGGSPTNSHDVYTSQLDFSVPMFLWGPGVAQGTNLYQLFSNRADPGTNRVSYTDTTVLQPLHNGDFCNIGLSLMGLPPIPGSVFQPAFAAPVQVLPVQVYLNLVKSGGAMQFSWPLNADGYALQYAPDLSATANWQTVTDGITTNGLLKYYLVTPVANTPAYFFRLRKP